MDKFLRSVGAVTVGFIIACTLAALFTFPIKWLVNYLFTPQTIFSLFGVYQLTFWKALALSTVCSLLFKGSASTSK